MSKRKKDPNAPAVKFKEMIDQNIREGGRQVVGVFPDHEDASHAFGYTIGNALKGFPELLLIGWCDDTMQAILNRLSEMMIERGHAFTDGELVSLDGPVPLKIIATSDKAKDDYTVQANVYYGSTFYDVMQVVVPDPNGKFADEPECQEPFASIPFLRRLVS